MIKELASPKVRTWKKLWLTEGTLKEVRRHNEILMSSFEGFGGGKKRFLAQAMSRFLN